LVAYRLKKKPVEPEPEKPVVKGDGAKRVLEAARRYKALQR
jgi:hypothetical protein